MREESIWKKQVGLPLLILLGGAMLFGILFRDRQHPENQFALVRPSNDLELLLHHCGQPDSEYTTTTEPPRPPIVMRSMTYQRAQLQITFLSDGSVFGIQDSRTKREVTRADAAKRLPCWSSR